MLMNTNLSRVWLVNEAKFTQIIETSVYQKYQLYCINCCARPMSLAIVFSHCLSGLRLVSCYFELDMCLQKKQKVGRRYQMGTGAD